MADATVAATAPQEDVDAPGAVVAEAVGFLNLRGRRAAYRESGPRVGASEGASVLLAHGSASHGGQWRALVDALGLERRVVAPDFFGYGRSDPAPEDAAPAYLHDAAILAELAEKEVGPVHLVGHGFGGLAAARVARDRPARVASLTLIEPAAFQLLEETDDPRRAALLEASASVTALVAFEEHEQAARRFIDFWSGEGAFDAMAPEAQAYVLSSAARIADDLRATTLCAPGQMTYQHFQEISPPAHLICGARSQPPARAVVARLRNALPHADYSEILDAGHMAAMLEPEKINAKIVRFIDAAEGAVR